RLARSVDDNGLIFWAPSTHLYWCLLNPWNHHLGALFGVVLTLPFGFTAFKSFADDLFAGRLETASTLALNSVLLLLPFILGFSTSLVIMVLNQFVEAVQSFFGKKTTPPPAAPPIAPPPQIQPTRN